MLRCWQRCRFQTTKLITTKRRAKPDLCKVKVANRQCAAKRGECSGTDSSGKTGLGRGLSGYTSFNIIYIMRTKVVLDRIQRFVIIIAVVIYLCFSCLRALEP